MATTASGSSGYVCCRFFLQVITGRCFMMFASFLIMACAGATYLFGVYSKDIKSTLGYDQSTLNLMSTFKDLGANVGILSGLLAEVAPTWFVLLVGALMNFTGYFMIWLAVTKRVATPKVWQMCAYICIGANSQNFANTGSLVTCVKNFPQSRGMMLGLMKGAMKISTHPNETKVLHEYLGIATVLALLIMALTIAQKKAIREEFYTWRNREQLTAPIRLVDEAPTLPETEMKSEIEYESMETKEASASGCSSIFKPPKRGEDFSILQALFSIDMFLVFLGTFCGLGCSLTAVDNLGQIGESLGYPYQAVSTVVSLLSIWNYFGRVFAGFVSEIILLKYKIPRPLIMSLVFLLAAVGDLLIAFPWPGSVYLASLLLGFSFGAQQTLLFTIVSELFGLKYYATLFNCAQLSSPLGSFVLNVRIVGKLYDKEAWKQLAAKGMARSMVKELTCIGEQCYRLSFSILAATNTFGSVVILVLVLRTRKYYGGDIYKRFRDEIAENEKEMALKSAQEMQMVES
ncbi:hypothetical protein GOBAR_DD15290 [Gossypium barbadense]|nr:hypothetical protein GOBAR_DD15290 [Gossypium barbadense]